MSADQVPILTVGYGNRPIGQFVELLVRHRIAYVVDVRSNPNSAYDQDYVATRLRSSLARAGVGYADMGDSLGGKPADGSHYDSEGRVDYESIRSSKHFLDGVDRIVGAARRGHRIALLCSELRPEMCHRSRLIGEYLYQEAPNIRVDHIDHNGNVTSQEQIRNRFAVASKMKRDQLVMPMNDLVETPERSLRSHR
ncbi:MAG: DUF488 domain-containing protein [Thermomicrobiales bacterium]|nr:DUF488 domain-containing protein [Thermomicrobiales bacterium]